MKLVRITSLRLLCLCTSFLIPSEQIFFMWWIISQGLAHVMSLLYDVIVGATRRNTGITISQAVLACDNVLSVSTARILCGQWRSGIRISAEDAFIVPCKLKVARLLHSLSTTFIIFGSNYADTSLKLILYVSLYTCIRIYTHVRTCICIYVHIYMCVPVCAHTNCRAPTLSSFLMTCVSADALGGPMRSLGRCLTLELPVSCSLSTAECTR